MNHSPLIRSFSLIASLSLLGMGIASGATEPLKKTTASKSKPVKSAKTNKAVKVASNRNNPSLKLTKADSLKLVPAASSTVTVNPYFVNQPAAILPKAVAPYLPAQAASTVVAAPVVAASVATTGAVAAQITTPESIATPPVSAAIASQAPVAPVATVAALPAIEKPAVPQNVAAAKPVSAPVTAYQPWTPAAAGYRNPYLAYQYQPMSAPQVQVAAPAPFPTAASLPDTSKLLSSFNSSVKSLLPFQPSASAPASAKSSTSNTSIVSDASSSVGSLFTSLKMMLPLTGDANILPTIKKVYPTGEKPLVVINFKCPTEVIGITPPPMKLLHEALNFGFDGLNKTNLLSFNLQQVCS
jgi:hypothetical protein